MHVRLQAKWRQSASIFATEPTRTANHSSERWHRAGRGFRRAAIGRHSTGFSMVSDRRHIA